MKNNPAILYDGVFWCAVIIAFVGAWTWAEGKISNWRKKK